MVLFGQIRQQNFVGRRRNSQQLPYSRKDKQSYGNLSASEQNGRLVKRDVNNLILIADKLGIRKKSAESYNFELSRLAIIDFLYSFGLILNFRLNAAAKELRLV